MTKPEASKKDKTVHLGKTLSRHAFLRVVAGLACVLVLAACAMPAAPASTGTEAEAGAAAAEGGDVVALEFWDMVWGPPEYVDTGDKVMEQFNAAHPNIRMTYQSTPWSSWPQVFTTAIGSGTAPDVSTGGGYQSIGFYPEGAILAINDVVDELKATGADQDFMANSLEVFNYEGNYVGLPWGFDIRVPYYRTDLWEAAGVAPPTNWDELRAALNALTTDNQYGIAFPGNNPSGWQGIMLFIFGNGGGLFDENGQLDVLNERNVEAVTFVSDLIKDGVVHPGSAGFDDAQLTRAFADGSAAMVIFTPAFEKRVPEQAAVTNLMSPFAGPHGDTGTILFINNIMLYSETEHPEEAKTFLKWYSDNQLPMWTEGHAGNLPARASIANNAYFQDDPLIKRILDEWVPIGKTTGHKYPTVFPELNEVDGAGVLNTFATDVLQGMDPVEALTKLEAALRPIVGQ